MASKGRHEGLPCWSSGYDSVPATQGVQARPLMWELTSPMLWGATCSIPWTEGPGGLQSVGLAKSQTLLSDQHFHFSFFMCVY